jgi:hypothetical protein
MTIRIKPKHVVFMMSTFIGLTSGLAAAQTAPTPTTTGAALARLTFEVNRNSVPVVTIQRVQMFQYSDYFKEEIPAFLGVIKNVSGKKLLNVSVVGIVHKKDSTVVKFNVLGVSENRFYELTNLPKNSVRGVGWLFTQPWPFKPAEFDSVEFILEEHCDSSLKLALAPHGGCVWDTTTTPTPTIKPAAKLTPPLTKAQIRERTKRLKAEQQEEQH